MRLTQLSDYTLRFLMYANRVNRLFTLQEVADELHMSRDLMIKISNNLIKLGYLTSIRGRNGGLSISAKAKRAALGNLIQDIEGPIQLVECFRGEGSDCVYLKKRCKLKKCLNRSVKIFIDALNECTLESIS